MHMLYPMQETVRLPIGVEFPKDRDFLVQSEGINTETGNVIRPLSYPPFFIFCPYSKGIRYPVVSA